MGNSNQDMQITDPNFLESLREQDEIETRKEKAKASKRLAEVIRKRKLGIPLTNPPENSGYDLTNK